MLWVFNIIADNKAEVRAALLNFIDGLDDGNNIVSFSRYQDGSRMYDTVLATNGTGLPLTQEAFDVAAKASAAGKEPPPAPAKRGRPAKAAAAIVDGPDGEPAAAMEESPFSAPPPVENPVTPAQMREKAIGLLQQAFANPAGPPKVRSLQTRLKVKKFNEVPDEQCEALLREAETLFASLGNAA
jgi:hypothetical protein